MRSAPLVFDLRGFVRDCENAGGELNCADYITARQRYRMINPISMTATLPRYEDEEVLSHADRNITIFLVQLSANVQYPPHNHNMAATIALCYGTEIATYYRLRGSKTEQSVTRTHSAGGIIFLADEAVHAVGNPGTTRSVALHIYYGSLTTVRRKLWNPETGDALPFTEENYLSLLRRWIQAAFSCRPRRRLSPRLSWPNW